MTQLEFIKNQLLTEGRITRNEMLRNFISRGAARIADLEKEGMLIKGEILKTEHGTDYVYKLIKPEQVRLI